LQGGKDAVLVCAIVYIDAFPLVYKGGTIRATVSTPVVHVLPDDACLVGADVSRRGCFVPVAFDVRGWLAGAVSPLLGLIWSVL